MVHLTGRRQIIIPGAVRKDIHGVTIHPTVLIILRVILLINVAVLSFDPNGKMEWSNIIRKTQYDDNTDNFIGFGLLNTGDQLHFIFNTQEKRSMVLSDQSVTPMGQIDRNPTFKNMDKGYEFMPRHTKQIGARQAIVPCQYRGFYLFCQNRILIQNCGFFYSRINPLLIFSFLPFSALAYTFIFLWRAPLL